jgi:hypothetical protein
MGLAACATGLQSMQSSDLFEIGTDTALSIIFISNVFITVRVKIRITDKVLHWRMIIDSNHSDSSMTDLTINIYDYRSFAL